ncbi:AMP-binding protein [Sediminibacter sp. Hel_I_10]|uniref:AMP-binding protein n=1 Tax=Sediminibacter sp. Hel_I_10 TaxID=1392490 RepID=UPI00055E8685|nr:AMP-binding protein [Sediminibacter sp. Hel_I_10]
MTPTYDKIHLKFKLNGINYDHAELKEVAYSLVKEGEVYEKVVGDFLLDWLDEKPHVTVNTSGSTGLPKKILLQKQSMINSALVTGDYFELEPGNTALHCLPSRYIAGKMMLIRAMILGLELDLVSPSSNPAYDDEKVYDFCAMIPLQLKNSLGRLKHIKTLIVGGAPVPTPVKNQLSNVSAKVYETYGMTETLSHIAVKHLNAASEEDAHFELLKNISIHKDDRDCLVINAPQLTEHEVVTNDIVNLISEDTFEIIGRYDNMINSGGIKLFPELIEKKLQDQIEQRFFVASEIDQDLGEKVILIIEGNSNELDTAVFDDLEKFEIPKAIYNLPKFIETETKKVQRQKTYDAVFA